MRPIEKFLNSGFFIATIFLITFFAWIFNSETPPYDFNLYNMIGMFVLLIIFVLILSFYENTLYVIPIIVGILYIVSKNDLTFDTLASLGFPYIALAVFMIGPIVHLIRFRPKFKKGALFSGLLLIAIAYVIPLIYTPFELRALPISLVAFLYLFVYVMLMSTIKGNIDYLMKIMLGVTLLLSAQMFVVIYRGFMIYYVDFPFYISFGKGIVRNWHTNFGWGNINDASFYLALTFPSITYFIFKNPKKIVYWTLLFIPAIAVLLSGSRGGMIGFGISAGSIFYMLLRHRNKAITKNGIIIASIVLVALTLNFRLLEQIWLYLIQSLDSNLDVISSSRISNYGEGLKIFAQYPLFGGGWLSIYWFEFDERIFMFHSTIIHVLATMGLFGLFALIIHYKQVFKVFLSKPSLELKLLMIGYIAAQVHGLIDNVQFSVPFSVWVVIIFSIIETSSQHTLFKKVDQEYLVLNNSDNHVI